MVQIASFLQAALTSEESFIDVLKKQGLPPAIQDIVMYGIAMVSTNQHTATTASDSLTNSRTTTIMTAKDGLRCLMLYAQSMGRFGSPGAFMFPNYGCGSIPEALVRHCAVRGCITALRQGVAGVLIHDDVGHHNHQSNDNLTSTTAANSTDMATPSSGDACNRKEDVNDVPEKDDVSLHRVHGLVMSSGQVLTCKEALIMGSSMQSR